MRYIIPAFLALPLVLAQPFNKAQNISTINWSNCSTPFPGACGKLTVPLDYTNSSTGKTLDLSMLRIDAVVKPSKGSILINQGGPGLDGVEFTRTFGVLLQVMTGGHYDIIGFDPRGTGETLKINCFPNVAERVTMAVPATTNSSNTALGTIWSYGKLYADNCYEQAREYGDLMGTAFVARDMMQIVDALGEDGMLRYWGQSYGTALGQTAAAMFPDRIDKMVIDGVVNIHEYTEGWEYENIPTGDLALTKFLEACLETKNQTMCALYRPNATVTDLTQRIHDLAEEVKFQPIILGVNATTDVITLANVKTALDTPLRIMIAYAPSLAGWLNAIFERNAEVQRLYRPDIIPDSSAIPGSTADAIVNIRCTDSTYRTDKLDDIVPLVHKAEELSYLYGDGYPVAYAMCAQWKFQAKGRYTGDFKAKTKNPMLIIGSPYDLRTPLSGAEKTQKLFEGSALLQHNGYGHCMMFSPGQCAIKAVQDYFTNGTLPKAGTVCEQDYGVFSGKSIWDSFGLSGPPTGNTTATPA